MSWKDDLKQAQSGGEGGSYPKLNISTYLDVKESGSGTAFKYYVKEEKINKYIKAPISGVLIGKGFKCSAFDDNYGANGGTFKSSMYLSNKNITMFSPSGKDRMTGSKEDISNWLISQKIGDKVSVKMCLLVATRRGLIEIQTNASIAIDQLNNDIGEASFDHMMSFTPTVYSPETPGLKKAKEHLGKFAATNPPKYASMAIGELITDAYAEEVNIEKFAKEFEVWKKFVTKGGVAEDETTEEPAQSNSSPSQTVTPGFDQIPVGTPSISDNQGISDDLPF